MHSEVHGVYDIADKFLPHHWNTICLVFVEPGFYLCRKMNNIYISLDNTHRISNPFTCNEQKKLALIGWYKLELLNLFVLVFKCKNPH